MPEPAGGRVCGRLLLPALMQGVFLFSDRQQNFFCLTKSRHRLVIPGLAVEVEPQFIPDLGGGPEIGIRPARHRAQNRLRLRQPVAPARHQGLNPPRRLAGGSESGGAGRQILGFVQLPLPFIDARQRHQNLHRVGKFFPGALEIASRHAGLGKIQAMQAGDGEGRRLPVGQPDGLFKIVRRGGIIITQAALIAEVEQQARILGRKLVRLPQQLRAFSVVKPPPGGLGFSPQPVNLKRQV